MPKDKNTIYLGVEFGLLIAAPMVGFLLLGLWIDQKLGTFPIWLIIGVVVGMVSAVLLVYKVIIPYLENKNNKNNNNK